MAAPTPLSAYTDGLTTTWHALGWAAGALTILLAIGCNVALLVTAVNLWRPIVRRRYVSWRLHREHARSGRG